MACDHEPRQRLPAYLHRRQAVLSAGASVLTALALGLPLAGCAQNEQLGRSQLILIDDEELERMSDMAESDIRRRSGGPLRDPVRQRSLERMAGRLSAVEGAPQPRRGFRPELLADRQVNAFVLPNGYSGYFDGMWGFVGGNSDEMAIIMGHEMGHLTGRHAQERVSQQLALTIGVAVLGTAAAVNRGTRAYSPAIGAALGLGAALGGAAFSRSHEYEADRLGLIYAARAGYEPDAASRFWNRMEAEHGRGGLSFLSTHPSHGDRRERLAALMREDAEVRRAIEEGRRRRVG